MLETVKRNWLAVLLSLGLVGLAFVAQRVQAVQPEDNGVKVVICHATSSEENPWVRIEVSENAIGGHFENPGTPLAGHEDDLLLEEGADCPEVPEEPEEPQTPEEPQVSTGGGVEPTTLPTVGADGI